MLLGGAPHVEWIPSYSELLAYATLSQSDEM